MPEARRILDGEDVRQSGQRAHATHLTQVGRLWIARRGQLFDPCLAALDPTREVPDRLDHRFQSGRQVGRDLRACLGSEAVCGARRQTRPIRLHRAAYVVNELGLAAKYRLGGKDRNRDEERYCIRVAVDLGREGSHLSNVLAHRGAPERAGARESCRRTVGGSVAAHAGMRRPTRRRSSGRLARWRRSRTACRRTWPRSSRRIRATRRCARRQPHPAQCAESWEPKCARVLVRAAGADPARHRHRRRRPARRGFRSPRSARPRAR